jgi:hypothetical protein
MSGSARCARCRRFVKAGKEHCDECAIRLYAWYLPDEMHWREVHHERVRQAYDDPQADPFGYGFPSCVRDPRDFIPDLECASEHERQNWIDSCRAADAGEPVDMTGNQHYLDGYLHISRTSWGLGGYIYREGAIA